MLFGKLFKELTRTSQDDEPAAEPSTEQPQEEQEAPKEVAHEVKYVKPLLRGTTWRHPDPDIILQPPRVPPEILKPCIKDLLEALKKYDLNYNQIDTVFYALADEISTRKEIAQTRLYLSVEDILHTKDILPSD